MKELGLGWNDSGDEMNDRYSFKVLAYFYQNLKEDYPLQTYRKYAHIKKQMYRLKKNETLSRRL